MSPEQLNKRLRAAAVLPPELDLAEATKLFLTPPPPPAPRPWYKNPMIMLSILVIMLTVIFSLYPENSQPELTAFPISASITPPPASKAITSLRGVNVTLNQQSPVPQRTIAPTALPFTATIAPASAATLSEVEVDMPATAPPSVISNSNSLLRPTQQSPLQSNTTFGQWEYRKKELYLKPEDPRSFTINIALSPAEIQKVKAHKNTPTAIKRAAGTLILQEGRRTGNYEFVPNTNFRDQLNAQGFGDQNYSLDEMPGQANTSNLLFQDVRTASNPQDLIWLRYFIANIDEGYLAKLKDFGYTDEELQQVWQLAVAQIYPGHLDYILANCKRMFTDRPPLADFRNLYYYPLASWLSPNDNFPMPYEDYKASYQAGDNGLFKLRPPAPIQPVQDVQVPLFPLSELNMQESFSIETADKIADTLQVENLKLLKVKGRIRLYLDKSIPEGQIIMYKKGGDFINVKRRSNRLIIENQCGADNVDVTANPTGIKSIATGKCAIMFFGGEEEE